MKKLRKDNNELALYKYNVLKHFTGKDRERADEVLSIAYHKGYRKLELLMWPSYAGMEFSASIHDLIGVGPDGKLRFLYME